MDVSSTALGSAVVSFPQEVLPVDATSILHPFSIYRLDAGCCSSDANVIPRIARELMSTVCLSCPGGVCLRRKGMTS